MRSMGSFTLKKMYLPAISIILVVGLLIVIIGVSTVRYLNLQKQRELESVHRQAMVLLRALEAGALTGLTMPMNAGRALENLVRETGKSPHIAYIVLSDAGGQVVFQAGSPPPVTGNGARPGADDEVARGRVITIGGEMIYDIVRRFNPFQARARHGLAIQPFSSLDITLGIRMTDYASARRDDIRHGIFMASILLILGCAAIFFLFVIQNYYMVDRSLAQTRDYTRQIIASLPNGLISVDKQGRIAAHNELAIRLLGLETFDPEGLELGAYMNLDRAGIQEAMDICKAVVDREILYTRPDGTDIPLSISTAPLLYENDRCEGAVVIIRDMREIRQLQHKVKQAEKLAAIGKMAAVVAHEIRNPLSSIRGFARFLSHSLPGRTKEKEYADVMVKEVDRISKVVSDLLSFSRSMEIRPVLTPVAPLFEHVLRLAEADIRSRGIVVEKDIPAELRAVLDPDQITQALLNLVLNAVQACPAGGTIGIGALLDRAGGEFAFYLENDGPAVPADVLPHIFDPFFTTREQGTGLGLAIVKKIIENHGGTIILQSPGPERPDGCVVWGRIPAGNGLETERYG